MFTAGTFLCECGVSGVLYFVLYNYCMYYCQLYITFVVMLYTNHVLGLCLRIISEVYFVSHIVIKCIVRNLVSYIIS